jgi:hypothetical protein
MKGTGIGGAVAVLFQFRLFVSEGTTFLNNVVNSTAGTVRGSGLGGGLYASVLSLNVRDAVVEANTITSVSSGLGVNAYGAGVYAGGDYSSGSRTFVSTTFLRNKGSVVLAGVSSGSSCTANGGGLCVLTGIGSTLNVSSSIFIGNAVTLKGGTSVNNHRSFGGT